MKDGKFSTKSQVDKNDPIMDFVTRVVVVFVVFSSPSFCFESAELKKGGVGHTSFGHDTLGEKEAVHTID